MYNYIDDLLVRPSDIQYSKTVTLAMLNPPTPAQPWPMAAQGRQPIDNQTVSAERGLKPSFLSFSLRKKCHSLGCNRPLRSITNLNKPEHPSIKHMQYISNIYININIVTQYIYINKIKYIHIWISIQIYRYNSDSKTLFLNIETSQNIRRAPRDWYQQHPSRLV